MNSFIDAYCERLGPGLLAEPLNLFTNLSFIIGAYYCWVLLIKDPERQHYKTRIQLFIAVILLFLIGVGSGLFHSFATRWAMALDVIPIMLFVLYLLYLYLRRAARFNIAMTIAGFGVLIGLSAFFNQVFTAKVFNGSQGYFGIATLLFSIGLFEWRRINRLFNSHLIAALLLFVSLFFRTVDNAWCPSLAIGTHFLWHIFNGLLLTIVLRAEVVREDPPREGRALTKMSKP